MGLLTRAFELAAACARSRTAGVKFEDIICGRRYGNVALYSARPRASHESLLKLDDSRETIAFSKHRRRKTGERSVSPGNHRSTAP